jgi:putative membrane protein
MGMGFGGNMGFGGGSMFGNGPFFGNGSIFGGGFMILFLVLIIVGIVFAVKWYGGSSGVRISGRAEDPVDILKKRYARGEVTRDEFDRMKQDLRV